MVEIAASPGRHQPAIDAALAEMRAERVIARIWERDHTVWKPGPAEIANRLGWLDSPAAMTEALPQVEAFVAAVRSAGYRRAVLLGMGGSSLAPEVFRRVLGVANGYLDLSVLDSTDPGAVLALAESLDLHSTLFIVSTKSGGTVETSSFFRFFYNRVADALPPGEAGDHFAAITDPGSGLDAAAQRHRFRATFLNNPDIGGRYSALSYFGIVPAALIGLDVARLLAVAGEAAAASKEEGCPAARLGAIMAELAKAGRDKLTLILPPRLAPCGDWVEQLVAESTGKEGRGILPVVGESIGPPESYAEDRLFVQLMLEGEEDADAPIAALEAAGHPVVRIRIRDVYDLGEQYLLWEIATAVAGARLGINPFDQPNVESAKVLAREMVAAYQRDGRLPGLTPSATEGQLTVYDGNSSSSAGDALRGFLATADAGDAGGAGRSYVALHAYIQPTPGSDRALQSFRTAIQRRYRVATTTGYGPRFLHSTGQLHKGDGGHGLFVQFTAAMPRDAAIPDEAGVQGSSITFGVLKTAQALGDRRALLDAGRRVIRFDLGGDVAGGLRRLAETLG